MLLIQELLCGRSKSNLSSCETFVSSTYRSATVGGQSAKREEGSLRVGKLVPRGCGREGAPEVPRRTVSDRMEARRGNSAGNE